MENQTNGPFSKREKRRLTSKIQKKTCEQLIKYAARETTRYAYRFHTEWDFVDSFSGINLAVTYLYLEKAVTTEEKELVEFKASIDFIDGPERFSIRFTNTQTGLSCDLISESDKEMLLAGHLEELHQSLNSFVNNEYCTCQ